MAYLLTFEFPSEGPFGAEAKEAYAPLANDIAAEADLYWKVWTEDTERKVSGGVYLFKDKASAEAYIEMHTKRLRDFGVTGEISAVGYNVNDRLSEITRAKLTK